MPDPEESTFQISQGYDVIPPKRGRAYPILCEEWEHLKGQIRSIKTSVDRYQTAGSILAGTSLSTLVSIWSGTYDAVSATDPKAIVIAWAITLCAGVVGAACFLFAYESRGVSDKKSEAVVGHMELIEKRYLSDDEKAG
jgi:hypothetical protein